MFGCLTINPGLLSDEEQTEYRAVYCGLCRELKARFSGDIRLFLNYECTFLALFLDSLEEPETERGRGICLVHPFRKREWRRSICTAYAADMTVALTYHKCRDDWKDEKKLLQGLLALRVKGLYAEVAQRYPRQCAAIEQGLNQLQLLEESGQQLPDDAAACFGRILQELFLFSPTPWDEHIRNLGYALGCFIYLYDAALDLQKDKKTGNYNPLLSIYGETEEPEQLRSILKLYLADVVRELEYLPVVQDLAILRSILCSGLWNRFNKLYSSGKESEHE